MNWRVGQNTGNVYSPDGKLAGKCYMGGNLGKVPAAINNHDYERVPKTGPLPIGFYTIQTPIEGSPLGKFAMPLLPDASNVMYGRSGFFWHGDSQIPFCGSEGCIVSAPALRHNVWDSADHRVEVFLEQQS